MERLQFGGLLPSLSINNRELIVGRERLIDRIFTSFSAFLENRCVAYYNIRNDLTDQRRKRSRPTLENARKSIDVSCFSRSLIEGMEREVSITKQLPKKGGKEYRNCCLVFYYLACHWRFSPQTIAIFVCFFDNFLATLFSDISKHLL